MADLSFKVTGGNRAHALGKRLKALGDQDLEKQLRAGISRALKPATQAVKQSVPEYMPSGYAPVLAAALQLRVSNVSGGLRITGQAKGRPRPRRVTALNQGTVRHPLWGDRNHWYVTKARAGFFDEPLRKQQPKIRAELDKVLDEVAAKLAE